MSSAILPSRRHRLLSTSLEPTLIATVLSPIERVRVDVAAQGTYNAIHRNKVDDVVNDLRSKRIGAVLLSVSRYDPQTMARMAAMVREFPRIPTFALLTDVQKSTPQAVHVLGQIGVRALVDVRHPSGWTTLRERLANEQTGDVQHMTLAQLAKDLVGVPVDCWRFFEVLFTYRPYVATVRQLGRCLYIHPTTLMSRFYRAHLPSPKRYFDAIRLVRAAYLLENTGLSVAAVTRQLDYSSPQAFGRHVRSICGTSAIGFREKFNGGVMLQQFRDELIVPYVKNFQTFNPIASSPGWVAKRRQ
jgi:AraC-like DNA-binding protein